MTTSKIQFTFDELVPSAALTQELPKTLKRVAQEGRLVVTTRGIEPRAVLLSLPAYEDLARRANGEAD